MIDAFMHYTDGRMIKRQIPNIDRFKDRHLDDLTGKSVIRHDFAYRTGQSEYLVSVHFDEVDVVGPAGRKGIRPPA